MPLHRLKRHFYQLIMHTMYIEDGAWYTLEYLFVLHSDWLCAFIRQNLISGC